jgi:hypothetical protein
MRLELDKEQEFVALARQIAVNQGHQTEADGLLPQAILEERWTYQSQRFNREVQDGKDAIDLLMRLGKHMYYLAQIRLRDPARGDELWQDLLQKAQDHSLDLEEIALAGKTVMESRTERGRGGKRSKDPALEKRLVQKALREHHLKQQGGGVRVDLTGLSAHAVALLDQWREDEGEYTTRLAFLRHLLEDLAHLYEQTQSGSASIHARLSRLRKREDQLRTLARNILRELGE